MHKQNNGRYACNVMRCDVRATCNSHVEIRYCTVDVEAGCSCAGLYLRRGGLQTESPWQPRPLHGGRVGFATQRFGFGMEPPTTWVSKEMLIILPKVQSQYRRRRCHSSSMLLDLLARNIHGIAEAATAPIVDLISGLPDNTTLTARRPPNWTVEALAHALSVFSQESVAVWARSRASSDLPLQHPRNPWVSVFSLQVISKGRKQVVWHWY